MDDWPGDPDVADIERGRGPWRPWHFVSQYAVSEARVRPDLLPELKAARNVKRLVEQQIAAVLISTAAIYRMMGKSETTEPEGDSHV